MSITLSRRYAASFLCLVFCLVSRQAAASGGVVITTPASAFAALTRDDPFSLALAATAGTPPFTWSLEPGSALPPGLGLSPAGLVTGAPTVGGSFSFTVRATAANASTGTRAYTVDVYRVPKPKPIDIPYSITSIYMPKPSWPSHQWGDLRLHNERNEIKATQGQRYPLLGYYQGDSPEVLDWQIKMAVDRGITTFMFHDYWVSKFPQPTYTTGIDAFRSARYKSAMTYGVIFNYCHTETNTGAAIRQCFLDEALPYYVANYFPEPNYLRIQGKPVIQIASVAVSLGSLDPLVLQGFMNAADQYIADHTEFDGAYWITSDIGATGLTSPVDFGLVQQAGFDAVSPGYVFTGIWPGTPNHQLGEHWPTLAWGGHGVEYSQLYASAVALQTENFQQSLATGVKYISAMAPDFDFRWIYWADCFLFFGGQNDYDYWQMVSTVHSLAVAYPAALAVNSNTGKPLVGIGPWNEHGESSTVEPSHTAFQWPGSGNADPFFVATAIAKLFGGPATYDEYLPGDYSRGFPVRSDWTFSTATGQGLVEWTSTTTAGLRLGAGDVLEVMGYGTTTITTATKLPLTPTTKVRVRYRVDEGAADFDNLLLDARGSSFSDSAHLFASSPEPSGLFLPKLVPPTTTVPSGNGFVTATFDVPRQAPNDTLKFLSIRFLTHPEQLSLRPRLKTSVSRVWIE